MLAATVVAAAAPGAAGAAVAGAPNVAGATPLIGGYPNGVADGFAPAVVLAASAGFGEANDSPDDDGDGDDIDAAADVAPRGAEDPKTEGACLLIIG